MKKCQLALLKLDRRRIGRYDREAIAGPNPLRSEGRALSALSTGAPAMLGRPRRCPSQKSGPANLKPVGDASIEQLAKLTRVFRRGVIPRQPHMDPVTAMRPGGACLRADGIDAARSPRIFAMHCVLAGKDKPMPIPIAPPANPVVNPRNRLPSYFGPLSVLIPVLSRRPGRRGLNYRGLQREKTTPVRKRTIYT